MGTISGAVALDRVSRTVGYKVIAKDFAGNTPNLPHRIAFLGQANHANQAGLTTDPFPFTNANEVGEKFGYGSELHLMARILRPLSGSILGGIETIIYPQLEAGGASATVRGIGVTVATSVTANVTHYIVINGRKSIDGQSYGFNPAIGDDAATVRQKMIDAVSNAINAPVTAAENVANVDFTSKWWGLTSTGLKIEIDTNGNAAGIVYAATTDTDGAGSPTVTTSLQLFSNEWNTIVLNPYGSQVFAELEAFNGVPDPLNPSGRYTSNNFKPFMALFGSTLDDKDDIVAITDAAARKDQVTNHLCPAPKSDGFEFEAAANMCATIAYIYQNSPHLGNGGVSYPDMPVPSSLQIGDSADYENRDYMVKRGASTVLLENGKYTVQDFVSTYHPDGETNPKYRFARNLNVLWNIAFGWMLKQKAYILDKTIVKDDDAVLVQNTISPKQVLQLISSYAGNLAGRALITDPDFTRASAKAGIDENNPRRMDSFFRTKLTSTADIVSTDQEFDFSF